MISPNRKLQPKIWQTTFLANRAIVRSLREEVSHWFRKDRTPKVLDVGCGQMPYREFFEGRCEEYVGCDLHPSRDGVTQCPADALAFEDESFDAVVSFQVLEHVRRPWVVMAECARVLKKRGLLLLSAPFIFPHHSAPHDFFRYTHEGLAALAEESGLAVEKITAQCSSFSTLLMMVNWHFMTFTNRLRRSAVTRPLLWILTGLMVVPLNVLGVMLDRKPFLRPFSKGNQGYSLYIMVARKPSDGKQRDVQCGRD